MAPMSCMTTYATMSLAGKRPVAHRQMLTTGLMWVPEMCPKA